VACDNYKLGLDCWPVIMHLGQNGHEIIEIFFPNVIIFLLLGLKFVPLFFFFFDMSTQEGEGGFELVTSAS